MVAVLASAPTVACAAIAPSRRTVTMYPTTANGPDAAAHRTSTDPTPPVALASGADGANVLAPITTCPLVLSKPMGLPTKNPLPVLRNGVPVVE